MDAEQLSCEIASSVPQARATFRLSQFGGKAMSVNLLGLEDAAAEIGRSVRR
jgi:hypothetical protein